MTNDYRGRRVFKKIIDSHETVLNYHIVYKLCIFTTLQ